LRKLPGGLLLLYEDGELLVVNKPAGLLSVAASGQTDKTAYWILAEYLRKKGEKRRPAAVHRLDRETSGVMLFVKSARAKRLFMENWDDVVTRRLYTAVVEGRLQGDEGIIDAPLADGPGGRVVVRADGKRAVTRWRRVGSLHGGALIQAELDTGRRNQIRAHFAHIGCPIYGDKKYGAKSAGPLLLHAQTLAFYHPQDHRLMEWTVPPKWFQLGVSTRA
jgi:23S rRNA pseudouridine1911/1915/1917 synthase